MAAQVVGNVFPEGKKLTIIATVYEAETGIEENDLHDKTLFTRSPYIFKFTRSKIYFRPGIVYYLKVDLFYPNGAPVTDQNVNMTMKGGKTREKTTDSNGRVSSTFETTYNTEKITFQVTVYDFDKDWTSDDFEVHAYKGRNQIEVEVATVNGQAELRAYSNTQGQSDTGMLFMVITRGKIVYTAFKNIGNEVSIEFPDKMKKMVSPSGRLLVFYADKSAKGEIVVNSVKFDVEHVCRGEELSLTPRDTLISPGQISVLNISGDPFMFVGLNIMDKALLLLNNKNVLKRNILFDTLESHDLGCGEGSGSNSADVYKRAGLIVLTNAQIDKQSLKGNPMECDLKHRVRRFAEKYCSGENQVCCEEGESYADEVIERKTKENIDTFATCYSKAKSLQNKDRIHSSKECVDAIFISCVNILKRHAEGKKTGPRFRLNDLFDSNPYTDDLKRAMDFGAAIRVRSDFRESWEFTEWDLDKNGQRDINIVYPDSITEWMIQAVGISKEGVCIAESANVKAFRDFFIQLYLPYKATRLEQLEVKATVFNYASKNMTANVYLTASKDLCYDSEAGISKPSRRTTVNIPSNSAQTVRFPVIPLRKGLFDVRAIAIVNTGDFFFTDEVKKQLIVENEGIEEKITILVCLDPHKQAKDCKQDKRVASDIIVEHNEVVQVLKVNLKLPDDAISNTGSGTAYLQVGAAIENVIHTLLEVEYLLQRPASCGENTMMGLAPTVYAMNYKIQTRTMEAESEIKGNTYIRYGIYRATSMFRHADGSYAQWRSRPSSTWLTAFVAKVFCQAKKVLDDAVDPKEDIEITIKWLVDKMEQDGSFIENMPVSYRKMIGQVKVTCRKKHPSLTAFVLISLQECSHYIYGFENHYEKTIQYVENLDRQMLRNNPYILAISTYALALSKSSKRFEFLNILKDIKISSDDDGTHWGNARFHPASADTVETTSYALLALLQLGDYIMSGDVVKWLTSQRNGKGAFRTTQDSVVGLQALSEYSIQTADPELNLKLSPLPDEWNQDYQYTLTNENAIFQKVIRNLPVEIGRQELTIEVKGQLSGRMMIDLRYNRHGSMNEKCGFTVSDIIVHDVHEAGEIMKCDVCGNNCKRIRGKREVPLGLPPERVRPYLGRKKRSRSRRILPILRCVKFSVSSVSGNTGMAVVIFGLETGVEVISDDLDKLIKDTENIDAYENDGKGFVVFYLSEISTNETNFKFRLKETFDDKAGKQSRQPAVVTVYDYYDPDRTCTKMYRSVGQQFSMTCTNSSSSMTCQCLSKVCPAPLENKLQEQVRLKKRPAIQLKRYTCNAENADFAAIVRITGLDYDVETKQVRASAFVTKSIHEGSIPLDDKYIVLEYSMDCVFPTFKDNKEYYIIGKESVKEYKYHLLGTSIIIEKPDGHGLLNSIMKKYEQLMGRGCDGHFVPVV
ncbi:Si dkey-8k3.2 [Mactra antiquata]